MAGRKQECPKCGIAKSAKDFFAFSKQAGNADGRSYHCRECESERQALKRAAKKPSKSKKRNSK